MRAFIVALYALTTVMSGALVAGCFVSTGNRRGEVRAEDRRDEHVREEEHAHDEHVEHEEEHHDEHRPNQG